MSNEYFEVESKRLKEWIYADGWRLSAFLTISRGTPFDQYIGMVAYKQDIFDDLRKEILVKIKELQQ